LDRQPDGLSGPLRPCSALPGSSQASALVDALQCLLLNQFLSDLDSVEGSAFPYVVTHNPKNQTVGM
jgi:hypothetical protein